MRSLMLLLLLIATSVFGQTPTVSRQQWKSVNACAERESGTPCLYHRTGGMPSLLLGLVAYYKMDGSSVDSLGAFSGVDTNMSYDTAHGIINQGANFIGGRIAIASAVLGAKFSIASWIKPSALAAYKALAVQSTLNGLFVDNLNHLNYYLSGDHAGASVINTSGAVWTFVAVTYDGVTVKLFVNGVQDGSFVLATSITVTQLGNDTANENFIGGMDEVPLYSRDLTQAEITFLFNNGKAVQYPFN